MQTSNIENHMTIGSGPDVILPLDYPILEEHKAEAKRRAESMTVAELFNWVDDLDVILAHMKPSARDEFLRAHRKLVAKGMAQMIAEGEA